MQRKVSINRLRRTAVLKSLYVRTLTAHPMRCCTFLSMFEEREMNCEAEQRMYRAAKAQRSLRFLQIYSRIFIR